MFKFYLKKSKIVYMKKYQSYKEYIDQYMQNNIINHKNQEFNNILKDSLSEGKRLRPIIVIDICNSLNKNLDLTKIGMSIEIIHNASLILDDLPCMDNDLLRRGKPTIHAKYNQTIANLTSEYLLQLAFKNMFDCSKENKIDNKIFCYVLENICSNIGIMGAAGGQFIDLNPSLYMFSDKNIRTEKYEELIRKKTTSLFEMCFIAGYLFSLGKMENVDKIKKCSNYFGLAFQISDDFEDIEQDKNCNKDNASPNYVNEFGKEEAYRIYNHSIEQMIKILDELSINSEFFKEIINFLNKRVTDNY